MADDAQRRIHGAVLSTALIRLCGGVLVLALYAAGLRASSGPTSLDEGGQRAERLLAESRDAFEASRYEDALQPTLALTAAFPNQQVYAERLALIYQRLNRPLDEAAARERVVDVSPTPVEACPALPDAYARAELADKSLDAFERCSGFETKNADMLFYLARAQERAGRAALAEAGYREVVRLDPANTDSQLGLARLDLRAGRLDEAARAAQAVLATYPDHADALLIAGTIAQREGRGADARRHLARALAIDERYVDVHIALGILEFSEGRVADARRHFDRAVQLDPKRRGELSVWLQRTSGAP